MRRFLFAVGLLATAAVSQSDAGYIVVRVVLEGAAGAGGPDGAPGTGGFVPPRPTVGPDGTPAAGATPAHDPTRSVFVVVPYTNDITKGQYFYPKREKTPVKNPFWPGPVVHNAFGHANLLIDNAQFQLYTDLGPQVPKGTRTRQTEIRLKHTQWARNPVNGQALLDLVTQALEAGEVGDAVQFADELLAAVQAKEKKTQATRQVEAFARAYAQVQGRLKARAAGTGDGPALREKLELSPTYRGNKQGEVKDQTSAHYTLIYWDASPAEVTRRLGQLEDNFKAFYLSFAARGIALPVPDRPLVAVLAKSAQMTHGLANSLDGLPRVADAFYAPEQGVIVLSPERLDGLGQTFRRQAQQVYGKGTSRDALLLGNGPTITPPQTTQQPGGQFPGGQFPGGQPPGTQPPGTPFGKDAPRPKDVVTADDVARMMTWAMADRIVTDEAEWSGVSREGSRQLLHASGVFPRHVALPVWLSEGAANHFHRPRDPVFSTKDDDKTYVTVAATTGYGVPNYSRQKQFAELVRLKELNADPGQTLRNVIADAYFAAARSEIDADDARLPLPPKKPAPPPGTAPQPGVGAPGGLPGGLPGGPPGVGGLGFPQPLASAEDAAALRRRKITFLANKAEATAWALYTFLARTNEDGLQRYLAELKALPRDLPLDEATRVAVFARAFDLKTPADYAAFATRWLDWMNTLPTTGVDIEVLEPTPTDGRPNSAGSPGAPGS